ncbi:MAG TPA: class I SAM-dependent methyltransferase [Casimicrobiaceae bacterium]|nr:class I SAM-dependent methyltransferase [Casimicrobiaceae bacterium]
MLWRLAVAAMDTPSLRPVVARRWYQTLAKKAKRKDWGFMNYGFEPPGAERIALLPADEPDRQSIQLYERVVSAADLAGARVLEVGSGRGGGASYLARYRHPALVIGADFAPAAVDLCRRQHAGVANLRFAVGDAEQLPFDDAEFDAVVNVESSHCYRRMEAFVAEAIRVLRPGGTFLFADFRSHDEMSALEALFDAQRTWTCVAREDITSGVLAALEATDAIKRRWIESALAPRFHGVAGEVAGVVGGEMHRRFKARELLYHRYAYRRT